MKHTLLTLAILLCAVSAQLVTRIVIDDFALGHFDGVFYDRPSASDDPVSAQASFTYSQGSCNNLLGCARDMEILFFFTSFTGDITSEIIRAEDAEYAGRWIIGTPKSTPARVSIEYDGVSGFAGLGTSSFPLSAKGDGAAGVDLTDNGLGTTLQFSFLADPATTFTTVMLDLAGKECRYEFMVTKTPSIFSDADTIYTADLYEDDKVGECDLTQIGYIQNFVTLGDTDDFFVRRFEITGTDPDAIESLPTTSSRWSLYSQACIQWTASAMPEETMTISLVASDSSVTIIEDIAVSASQYEWPAIYGVIPGTVHIEFTFTTSATIFGEDFELILAGEGVSYPCPPLL